MQKTKGKQSKEQQKALKIILIGIFLVLLLIGFYYYVAHRSSQGKGDENGVLSRSQELIGYNLETKYPPSPKEVVKLYCEITKCFYNETHSEEELKDLALQMQKLYDDELAANQTQEEYIADLKAEIASMQSNSCVISSYSTSASTDVEYYTLDGFEWAKLYCSFGIRAGTTWFNSNEQFLLRKDSAGHWKIYGWKLAEE